MIKLVKNPKPVKLTDELQEQLTKEFKRNKTKAVWNKKYIREGLLKESNGKCAYCECFVGRGHKEMHVDHFHYKDKYEDEVVKWDNLLPACPHCNKKKSTHDTYLKPIINPFLQNPQDYFYIKQYRYYSKNRMVEDVARETIGVLGLNDTEEISMSRFLQGEALSEQIQDIYELAKEHKDILMTDTQKRNRVLRGCKNILKKGTPKAEFAAFMATIIQTDDDFARLKELLKELKLWNNELDLLDIEVQSIVLSVESD